MAGVPHLDLAAAQALFDPQPGWLNTASYGLPPRPAVEAVQAALEVWRRGSASWEPWDESTGLARESFARLVGVPASRVAVGATVSELIGLVAAALPDGARVVVPDVEFTSNLFPWMVHADRGVEVVTVPTSRLVEAVTPGTALVAFGVVQSATGEVLPYDDVVAAARAVDALVVADATQAVGWLPVDASQVDALACGGYKWLMSPRGTAFLTVGERLQERLRPLSAGWYAGADVHSSYYGPPLRLAQDARRFDVSPAWFSWVGTAPALDVLEQVGVDAVHDHDVALANRFRAGLDMAPSDSAIVSASVPGATERLERAGIRAASRAGSLRVSFHLYSTEADVDAALDALLG
jgi:selenocysteine lyase/cysteine desulfurase